MSTISDTFKNHILDCMEEVVFTTVSDLAEAIIPRIQRRPHIETVRKALLELQDDGLVEGETRGKANRGWHRIYWLARTKPVIGSLRKAA